MTKEIANRVLWAIIFVTLVWGTQGILTIGVKFQDNLALQTAMQCADPKVYKNRTVSIVTHEGGMYTCRPPVKLRR